MVAKHNLDFWRDVAEFSRSHLGVRILFTPICSEPSARLLCNQVNRPATTRQYLLPCLAPFLFIRMISPHSSAFLVQKKDPNQSLGMTEKDTQHTHKIEEED